jgi:hypothetical protein
MMVLEDVVATEQFADYYRENGISTPEGKIKKLRDDMGILGIQCEEKRSPEEIVELLQYSALEGYWRAR